MMIVISGPSASGKTTLQEMLAEDFGYAPVISTTTREPREQEEDGEDYYFVTDEEFNQIKMAEKVMFDGVQYGLSGDEIRRCRENSDVFTAVVEPHGAILLRDYCATHEIKFMSVFLYGGLTSLVSRFLNRELNQVDISKGEGVVSPRAVSRIIKLIAEEHPTGRHSGSWDMYFSHFDLDNATTVMDQITERAEQIHAA